MTIPPQLEDLLHPVEAPVVFCVYTLQVLQSDGPAQQLLVEGQGEASIDIHAVEHGHSDHSPHKVEVGQVLLRKNMDGWKMKHKGR